MIEVCSVLFEFIYCSWVFIARDCKFHGLYSWLHVDRPRHRKLGRGVSNLSDHEGMIIFTSFCFLDLVVLVCYRVNH